MSKWYVIILLLVTAQSIAQKYNHTGWYEGQLILRDDLHIKGELAFDMNHNVVQLRLTDQIRTFSANQIVYFSIASEIPGKDRHFFSLPSARAKDRNQNSIYELIVHGKMSLLSREYLRYHTRNKQATRSDRRRLEDPNELSRPLPQSVHNTVKQLYLADEDGNVTLITKNRKKVLDAFGIHREQMKKYIQERMLTAYLEDDLVQIVNHFNNIHLENAYLNR